MSGLAWAGAFYSLFTPVCAWALYRVSQLPFPSELIPRRRDVRPPGRLYEDAELTSTDDTIGLV